MEESLYGNSDWLYPCNLRHPKDDTRFNVRTELEALQHAVDSLTPEMEDRILTAKLSDPLPSEDFARLVGLEAPLRAGCFWQVAYARSDAFVDKSYRWYDELIVKFGVDRIAQRIRTRILRNRTRRTLAPTPDHELVEA